MKTHLSCCGYINSSTNLRATSGGIREFCFTNGSVANTGSESCKVGTSVRSKNLPMGISSPQSRDFSIAAIQLVESYSGLSSSFFTRGRNHWKVLSWLYVTQGLKTSMNEKPLC